MTPERPAGTDLACPKCLGPIRYGNRLRGAVAPCYDCWGLWIDTGELNCMRERFPVGAALYKATLELRAEAAGPTDMLCPACPEAQLVRQVIREVEIEWCPRCRGVYLDKGERERLLGLASEFRPRGPGATPSAAYLSSPGATGGALDVGVELIGGLFELLAMITD
jgi:Zn-finger nucleic acid-binding protein